PISPDRVLAHSDVAPARKQDPGEKFPWALLNVSGVGHWVPPAPLTAEGDRFQFGDSGEAVAKIQLALSSYGYGVPATGTYDDTTRDVVTAFQRHFRQGRVDGVADPSTLQTLHALLKARPAPFGRPAATPAHS
ncbi:MAG TPA: peptidoglycan-binding protein, partial [Pseudolabrys sp.]|nr:peptidoglycan-binding protein [Pseudolabrys sp.]